MTVITKNLGDKKSDNLKDPLVENIVVEPADEVIIIYNIIDNIAHYFTCSNYVNSIRCNIRLYSVHDSILN